MNFVFIVFLSALTFITSSTQSAQQDVKCLRLKDSMFAHYLSCNTQKPLPLKAQLTVQLDQDYTWPTVFNIFFPYLLDGVNKNTLLLQSNCILALPTPGRKLNGTNLTIALQCNTLPRELKQYDMIKYQFQFNYLYQYLQFASPIPGYSTNEDVQNYMRETSQQKQQIKAPQNLNPQTKTSLLRQIKRLQNIRKKNP